MTTINHSLILITGASSGIGAATAKVMAHQGARLALLARTSENLAKVSASIDRLHAQPSRGFSARIYPVDLTDANTVDQVAQQIKAEMGVPDIIVNSAGSGRWLFAEETDPNEVVQMMGAPYFAAFSITRAFLPEMLKRNSGHVVNVNSPASKLPWPGATAYSAARWAMKGFTEALRADLWRTNIHVTSIVAGKVETGYWQHNPGSEERSPRIARLIPTLTAEQVANAIVDAIEHNKREVIIPFMLRVFYLAYSLAPRLVERIVWGTGYHRGRSA